VTDGRHTVVAEVQLSQSDLRLHGCWVGWVGEAHSGSARECPLVRPSSLPAPRPSTQADQCNTMNVAIYAVASSLDSLTNRSCTLPTCWRCTTRLNSSEVRENLSRAGKPKKKWWPSGVNRTLCAR
jgi:hypothetical protein